MGEKLFLKVEIPWNLEDPSEEILVGADHLGDYHKRHQQHGF